MAETMEPLNKNSIFEIVQDNLMKSQSSTYSLNSTWSAAINRRGEIHLKDYDNMFSPLSSAGKLICDCVFRTDLASMHDFLEMMEKFNFEESDFGNPFKRNLVSGQHYSNSFMRYVNIFKKVLLKTSANSLLIRPELS